MNLQYATVSRRSWYDIVARHADLDFERMARRGHVRYEIPYGHAVLHFLDIPENDPHLAPTATILQISTEGLMLRVFEPYKRGREAILRVSIDDEECVVHARIMHCTESLGGFKLGLKLLFEDAP